MTIGDIQPKAVNSAKQYSAGNIRRSADEKVDIIMVRSEAIVQIS